MKELKMLSGILVLVGAINWGLIGLFDMNLVQTVVGVGTVEKVVYSLVGLAGLHMVYEMYLVPAKSKKGRG